MSESSVLDSLPRSVRWRIQLGLLDHTSDLSSQPTLENIYSLNASHIAQQNSKFQELMEKYVHEEEEEQAEACDDSTSSKTNGIGDGGETGAHTGSPVDVDPLTAMVMEQEARETRKQELYLKYRKERARRKRGLVTELSRPTDAGEEDDGLDRASLSIIEKDLKRLPHPLETARSSSSSIPSSQAPTETSDSNGTTTQTVPCPPDYNQEARIASLREILYIYSQEHPNMGYRQGMHEIASFLLLVLELDEPHHHDNPLFSPILPVAYALLESVLEQLQIAYDASVDHSLQHMSLAILSKLYQNNPTLHLHLTTSPSIPPPPIYCTRWVRLLFSREVVGYQNVLKLWDVFMEEQSKPRESENQHQDDDHLVSAKVELMHVLEITAASRILLMTNELLDPENNPLDLLMNVPALADIGPLTTTLRRLLRQGDLDEPIQIPAGQLLPPPTPSPEKQCPLGPPAIPQQASPQKAMSLKSLRQTLGQRGESIKNKIISTTSEWKSNIQQRESNNVDVANFGTAGMSLNSGANSMTTGGRSGGSASADMAAAAVAAIRNHQSLFMSANNKSTETVLFGDPLLNPQLQPQKQLFNSTPNRHPTAGSQMHGVVPSPSTVQLPSNQYNSHQSILQRQSMWSQDMQRHIWTVQQFLMFVEQQKSSYASVPNDSGVTGAATNSNNPGVPREVWEAMADLDRIQKDLQNHVVGGM